MSQKIANRSTGLVDYKGPEADMLSSVKESKPWRGDVYLQTLKCVSKNITLLFCTSQSSWIKMSFKVFNIKISYKNVTRWSYSYKYSQKSTLQTIYTSVNIDVQCTGLNKYGIVEENINVLTERCKNPSGYTFVHTHTHTHTVAHTVTH